MRRDVVVLAAIAATLMSAPVWSEQLGRASYRDVCKKMADEGITSRTQSGASDMGEQALGNALVVIGSSHSAGGKRNHTVSNSEIIVSADLNNLVATTHNEPNDSGGGIAPQTNRSSACD